MRSRFQLMLSPAVFAAATLSSSAVVLVQDDFNGTAGDPLAGTTPDANVGGTNWAGHATVVFNSNNVSTTGTGVGATLDLGESYFSANQGTYTLTADIFFPSAATGSGVLAIGFTVLPAGTGASQSLINGGGRYGTPYLFLRANGEAVFRTGSGTDTASQTGFVKNNTYTLKLVLNTGLPLWTVDAFIGSTQLDLDSASSSLSYVYTSGNPTDIRHVGIASSNTAGTIDNFALNFTAVPEPASAILTTLGALGFSTLRRRRN